MGFLVGHLVGFLADLAWPAHAISHVPAWRQASKLTALTVAHQHRLLPAPLPPQSLINIAWAFATLLGHELRQLPTAHAMFGNIRSHIVSRWAPAVSMVHMQLQQLAGLCTWRRTACMHTLCCTPCLGRS